MLLHTKTTPSSPSSLSSSPELPPSYDFATALLTSPVGASAVGSSSSSQESQAQLSHISHLFTTPPSAEPLLGRPLAPAEVVAGIEIKNSRTGVVSHDPKLANRMLVLYDFASALTRSADVLYDFLRAQSLIHPAVKLRCTGMYGPIPFRAKV